MAEERIIYQNKAPKYTVKEIIEDDGTVRYVCNMAVPDGIDPTALEEAIEEQIRRTFPLSLALSGQYMQHGLILDDPHPISPKTHTANGVPMGDSDCIFEVTDIPDCNRDFSTANPALREKNT